MLDKPYHHGNLKSCLIEGGIELINQIGAQQFSLRKVCTLCGVSQTAPYSHFKNKDELLEAMQNHVIGQFMDELKDAIASCPNPDSQEAMILMGKRYVMFFINNPQYFQFLFSQTNIKIDLSLDSGADNFPPLELLKSVFLRIFGETVIPKEKKQDMIIALWATVHGLASIATMKNVRYDQQWENKIIDIIWNR
jgi:AcrR family transcriptional regulator